MGYMEMVTSVGCKCVVVEFISIFCKEHRNAITYSYWFIYFFSLDNSVCNVSQSILWISFCTVFTKISKMLNLLGGECPTDFSAACE